MSSEGKLEGSHMEENSKEPKLPTEDVKVEEKTTETENSRVEEKKTETESANVEKKIVTEMPKVEEKKNDEDDGSKTVKEREMEVGKKVEDEPAKTEPESSLSKEENNASSDLKENEMKALNDLRSKLEEAILQNKLFKSTKEKEMEREIQPTKSNEEEKDVKDEKEKEQEKEETTEKAKTEEPEKGKDFAAVVEEAQEKLIKQNTELKPETEYNVDQDIAIWGVPLLPSKGDNRTDTVLLKFLRARDFRVNDAFEMLKKTLKWRRDNKIDSILDEDLGAEIGSMAILEGHDRNGHPVCYNIFSVLSNEDIYSKTFEERREKFVRGRIQIMEKGIQKLDFKPGGVSALLQISDLKNTPLPTKKELRNATKKVVELLQDNYPEFIAKNVFVNVPFWYYAYSALFSPSLSQRTKGKIVYARSSRVSDTLLKYIPASQLLVQYGGLKKENDAEFSIKEEVKEATVKSGSAEVIEIQAPEEGKTLVWEVSVSGWEVNYREEFVPADEGSYIVIVSKGKRIGFQEGMIRNSFTNKEPGKIVITIENGAFKKKRILYRHKISSSS